MKNNKIYFENDNMICLERLNSEYYDNENGGRFFCDILEESSKREPLFRKIHSLLIKGNDISGNIIDGGSYIGDNSLPWALQIEGIVYCFDPSALNIRYTNMMARNNNIKNIVTFCCALSDKKETLGTNDGINHCKLSDSIGKRFKVQAESIDNFLESKKIENIGYIHLDVEGYEEKAILGASRTIKQYKPVLTFEQHVKTDDYGFISSFLSKIGYDVFVINEILVGNRKDCRNFIAFNKNKDEIINKIINNLENSLIKVEDFIYVE